MSVLTITVIFYHKTSKKTSEASAKSVAVCAMREQQRDEEVSTMAEEKKMNTAENNEKNDAVCRKKRGALALKLFKDGYNCSQAVTLAFADELEKRGISREMAAAMASSFGGGLGRLREVCGCVSGMALVCGALEGYGDPKATTDKKEHYKRIQDLAEAFKAQNGSYICRELLAGINSDTTPVPEARTEGYYKKRPGAELAACAADILEQQLEKIQK